MVWRSAFLVAQAALSGVLVAGVAAAQPAPTEAVPATPTDPVDAILDAFDSHSVVAMTEGLSHGHVQGHELLVRLMNDPRFSAKVDDVVVEWGNSFYQSVIDRYTSGADVPYDELKQVWQTTSEDTMWDMEVYEEFYRAVRLINASLPKEREIRVLLGDPPIDWSQVRREEEWEQFLPQQTTFPVTLITDEVIAKGRRALTVFGGGNYLERDAFVRVLQRDEVSVFIVTALPKDVAATVQRDVASWGVPAVALLAGTTLGRAPMSAYSDLEIAFPLEVLYDAVVVWPPRSELMQSYLSPALCVDAEYLEMRRTRMPWRSLESAGLGHCLPAPRSDLSR